jgi:hypothetical protein
VTLLEPAEPSIVANERVKLTATYLNGIAIAIFAVGAFSPTVALANGALQPSALLRTIALAIVCLTTSAILHSAARRSLRGLRR